MVGATVSGAVTAAEGGAPLEGIAVELSGDEGSLSTTTTTDGTYSFTELAAGSYTLTVDARSTVYVGATRGPFALEPGLVATENFSLATSEEVAVAVEPTYTLTGTVTSGGAPVNGLTVNVNDPEYITLLQAVTDENGAYSVSGITSSSVIVSTNFEAGYLPHWGPTISLSLEGTVYDFVVNPLPTGPGSVSGLILDRVTGEPVPNAEVYLNGATMFELTRFGYSDENGAYSFDNLPLTTVEVRASLTDYGDTGVTEYYSSSVYVSLSESSQNRVRDVRLTPVPTGSGVIFGCFTESDSTPIAFLSLFVTEVRPGQPSTGGTNLTTDESGCYSLGELPAGEFEISYIDFDELYTGIDPAEAMVTLETSESIVERNFVLQRYPVGTATLVGSLTDSRTGLPIQDAVVILSALSTSNRSVSTTTDGDGGWSFENLAAGQYVYSIFDFDNRFENSHAGSPVLTIADGATVVRVDTLTSVIAGTGSLSGRVRDAVTHAGVAGAEISLYRERGGYFVDPVTADESGDYQFDALPAGLYYVEVTAPGYAPLDSGIQIDVGAETLNLPLRSVPPIEEGDGAITGLVTNSLGEPLYGVGVSAFAPDLRNDGSSRYVTTDADGLFEIGGLALTDWELYVQNFTSSDLAPAEYSITLSTLEPVADITVVLDDANTITGVVDFSAVPAGSTYALELVALDIETGLIKGFGSINMESGAYSVSSLADGDYVVMVIPNTAYADPVTFSVSPAYWVDSVPTGTALREEATVITLSGGEVRTGVDLALSEGGSISGRVFVGVPDGVASLAPGKQVQISAYRREGAEWVKMPFAYAVASNYTSDRYQLVGLSPGEYRLEFKDYFEGSRSLATTYNGGGTVFEEAPIITVEAGAELTGRDVVMSMRRPDSAPSTLVLDDLGDGISGLQGQIGVPGELTEGDEVTVTVGGEFAGEWVSVWANSAPTRLGDWVQVTSGGTIAVSLPDGLVGSHRIAVQDADSALFGWAPVTVEEQVDTPDAGPGAGSGGGSPPSAPPASNQPIRNQPIAADVPPAPAQGESVEPDSADESSADEETDSPSEPVVETLARDEAPDAAGVWLWILIVGTLLALVIGGIVVAIRRRTA